jgi:hypothetical protein
MTHTTDSPQEQALLDAFRRLSPARRDALVVAVTVLTADDAQPEHVPSAATAKDPAPCA